MFNVQCLIQYQSKCSNCFSPFAILYRTSTIHAFIQILPKTIKGFINVNVSSLLLFCICSYNVMESKSQSVKSEIDCQMLKWHVVYVVYLKFHILSKSPQSISKRFIWLRVKSLFSFCTIFHTSFLPFSIFWIHFTGLYMFNMCVQLYHFDLHDKMKSQSAHLARNIWEITSNIDR